VTALFISDLHLHANRPAGIEQFLTFIRTEALEASSLYILGDLFEAWIGDDDNDPTHGPIIAALAELKRQNVPCYFMHGNRDFLIGRQFAAATGCRLLEEWHVADIAGRRVLLTHGDLLCTDDTPYLQLRAMVRDPAWQREFLAKPLHERRAIADSLRERSQTETAAKPAEIMDVNDTAVAAALRAHGAALLLHGHTHRPSVHEILVDGQPATRIVLGAWYEQGSVVRWDESGFRLEALEL
jgi:UDP-2,3-diacylglucosamine hydrolase